MKKTNKSLKNNVNNFIGKIKKKTKNDNSKIYMDLR